MFRAQLELLPDVRQVGVERAGGGWNLAIPDAFGQHIARHEPAQVAKEQQRELELLGRQRDLRAIERDRARSGVDAIAGDVERFVGRLGDLAAAQQRRDAGQQFQRPQRLDDVVVGAGAQAFHQVVLAGPVGQEDDGNARADVGAQPAHHIVAVDIRQVPVQQHQVKRFIAQSGKQVTALLITGAGVSGGSQDLLDTFRLVQVVFQRRDFHQTWSREGWLRKRALWRPTARRRKDCVME